MAGFECSSHRRRDGVRLDLIRATGHDRSALKDYAACKALGLSLIRDGLRWHRIAPRPGVLDFSDWSPFLDAALDARVDIIWDLCHYGWPDHLDPNEDDFVPNFVDFAVAAAEFHRRHTGRPIRTVPINEISFLCHALERGEIRSSSSDGAMTKRRLVRAAVRASKEIRANTPGAKVYGAEPLIHVAPLSQARAAVKGADIQRRSQFEVYDMMLGLRDPELGGSCDTLDALGFNYYPHNQWYWNGSTIPLGHHEFRPLRAMLIEVWERYGKINFISETGAEGSARSAWLHYVASEARSAMSQGVRVDALCLYPVTNYPGWENSRDCHTGLFNGCGPQERSVDRETADELARQQGLFSEAGSFAFSADR